MDHSWPTHVLETYIQSNNFGEVVTRLEQVLNKKSKVIGIFINVASNEVNTYGEFDNIFSVGSSEFSLMLDKAQSPVLLSEIWRNKIFFVSVDRDSKNNQVHYQHRETFQSARVTLNIPLGRNSVGQYIFAEFTFGEKHIVEQEFQVSMLENDEIEFIQKFLLVVCKNRLNNFDVPEILSSDQSQSSLPFKENPIDSRYRLLSERQLRIAELLNGGYTNQEVARSLHVSVSTVKLEVSRVIRIFEVKSRKDLPA